MKKKILIGVGALVLIILAGMMYLNYRNRSLSPPGLAEYKSERLTITIPYSRPSQKGRLIFGTEEDGALQPYGVYWRLGANEATEVTFSRDVTFNGNPIEEGTYRMYAFPGEEEFEIRLSKDLGKWGAFEPDYSLDVLTTMIPHERGGQVEQFTIRFEEKGDVVEIICEWADTTLRVPVE